MKFKTFEDILDDLLKELAPLRIWSEHLAERIQQNYDAFDALDLENPMNQERCEELVREAEELREETKRFEMEYQEAMKKVKALTGKYHGHRNKPN